MTSFGVLEPSVPALGSSGVNTIGEWIQGEIASSPNKAALQRQLDAISGEAMLPRFLHRFVMFNDALAARVPFVAGLIHLTPDIFIDLEEGVGFCRQVNGRIAAYVAEAASDEYRLLDGQPSIHQHLSQIFLNGALAHFGADRHGFDQAHPFPAVLADILTEAREIFLTERAADSIFRALGFHVGLEFFADQEFNLVDKYLKTHHPGLVAALSHDTGQGPDYAWLALHTMVEIGHYRAGLEALKAALRYYRDPGEAAAMAERIKEGFRAFVDLQARYYDAIHQGGG